MRYLSLIFIVVLMSVSWKVIQSSEAVPETTHIDIQDDFKVMIIETLQKSLPNVKDIKFDRFWTQNLATNKIKAGFQFSFDNNVENDSPARYGIEGHATLTYDPEKSVWNVDGPHFLNNEITFKDGMVITPGPDDGE